MGTATTRTSLALSPFPLRRPSYSAAIPMFTFSRNQNFICAQRCESALHRTQRTIRQRRTFFARSGGSVRMCVPLQTPHRQMTCLSASSLLIPISASEYHVAHSSHCRTVVVSALSRSGATGEALARLAFEGSDAAARLLRPGSLFHWFLHLQQTFEVRAACEQGLSRAHSRADTYASSGLPRSAAEISHHLPSWSR